MLHTFSPDFENRLYVWVKSSLKTGKNNLAGGYQGKTLLYNDGLVRLVVKVPPRSGLQRILLTAMLRHENRAYEKLQDVDGVPRCYGLLRNRFLVLEYIEGFTLRDMPAAGDAFFAELLAIIKQIHAAGVAHVDLKKKDNILVSKQGRPYLIDFGSACIRKRGFRPFNHYLFQIGKQFDFNAWIKHKYGRRYHEISEEDRIYLKRTWIEDVSRFFKQPYRAVRRKIKRMLQ